MSYKNIPGFPNYQISECGIVYNKKHQRTVSWYLNKQGYWEVDLYIDGASKKRMVHRLVALTYIPNPENKPQVNHKDGDRQNPNKDNLEWATNAENVKHRVGRGGGRISKKKILKLYHSKDWNSVEEFLVEIIKI